MTWVSVEDGLPEVEKLVWVATPTNEIAMRGFIDKNKSWIIMDGRQIFYVEPVTHHMPISGTLPDLPELEK